MNQQNDISVVVPNPKGFIGSSQNQSGATAVYSLDFYNSVFHPKIEKEVSVEWWLKQIKEGNNYKTTIERARSIGKGNDGYEKIKKSLPCVTWNFRFNEHKSDKNIIGSTGFIYFDIDIEPDSTAVTGLVKSSSELFEQPNSQKASFNLKQLDSSKVFSYFSSLSNQGTTIIVRVQGITIENFDFNYLAIADQLGISSYIDKNAIKKTQYTVLTYDPKLFVNWDSFIFQRNNPPEIKKENKKVSLASKQRKDREHLVANDTFFRVNNRDQFVNPEEFKVNKVGFDLVEIYFTGYKIKESKRTRTLAAYCQNLVYLNQTHSFEQVFNHMLDKNNKRCEVPLEEKEVWGIVDSIYRYKESGTLVPIKRKNKKFIFGSKCGLDKHDKLSLCAKQIAEWKAEKTKHRIYDAIENNAGKKITINTVALDSELSIATVKRYWPEFKDFVKDLNQQRKEATKQETIIFTDESPHQFDLSPLGEQEQVFLHPNELVSPELIRMHGKATNEPLSQLIEIQHYEEYMKEEALEYPPGNFTEEETRVYHEFLYLFTGR